MDSTANKTLNSELNDKDLQLDSIVNNVEIEEPGKVIFSKVMMLFISMFITSVSLLIIIYGLRYTNTLSNYISIVAIISLIICSGLIYSMIEISTSENNMNYFFLILHNRSALASISLSSVIVLTLHLVYCPNDINLFLISFTVCIFFYFLQELIVEILNYKMHFNTYEYRLKETNKNSYILSILTKITNSSNASEIFMKLSRNNMITKESLSRFLDHHTILLFFEIFDKNNEIFEKPHSDIQSNSIFNVAYNKSSHSANKIPSIDLSTEQKKSVVNHSISKDQFTTVFDCILQERFSLILSISSKNTLLSKLRNLLLTIFSILAFFIIEVIYKKSFDSLSITGHIQTVLSMNFIFGSLVQDIFKSIVYVFLVRLFDIDDYLLIDNKLFIVKDIGLLYSTFEVDSKITIISNNIFMKYNVINLRLVDFYTKEYTFNFDTASYNLRQKELRNIIKKKLAENKLTMKNDIDIHIEDFKNNSNLVKVKFNVTYKLGYYNIKQMQDNENQFFVELLEVLNGLKLDFYV